MLLGSNIQPSLFEDINTGKQVTLGEIVAHAFDLSNKTEKEWNNLPSNELENRIETARIRMGLREFSSVRKCYE